MSGGPGPLVLFGSGETSRSGRQVHEEVLRRSPSPVRIAILPTPAGFQPNADAVAGRLAQFARHSLVNHRPEVVMIDAKRRGGDAFGKGDPDDPAVAARSTERDTSSQVPEARRTWSGSSSTA